MASNFDDVSLWRLQTPGGIKFKSLGLEGAFSFDAANVDFSILIQSSQLIDFILEIFPASLIAGNIEIPQTTALPGLPTLAVKNLAFKSFDTNLPIDPFGADPSAPSSTYYKVIKLVITYGPTRVTSDVDPNDPFTWIEISADASGEFLHSTTPKNKWEEEVNEVLGCDDDQDVNKAQDPITDRIFGGAKTDVTNPGSIRVKNQSLPYTITVPKTAWTLRWPRVPFEYFRDVLIHRMRAVMGRVNSKNLPLLFNADPETLLFVGYQYQQINTWRDGFTNTPPVTISMNILEKRVNWNGVIIGHNHFWQPGVGWTRLQFTDACGNVNANTYKRWDFNRLFLV